MKVTLKFIIAMTLVVFSRSNQASWMQVLEKGMTQETVFTTANNNKGVVSTVAESELTTHKDSYSSNELVEITYRYANKTDTDQVSFDLSLTENNQFLRSDSVLSPDSTMFTLTIDNQQLHWQGTLLKPQLDFSAFSNQFFGYIPLEDTFEIPARTCGATCNNDIFPWNINFTFQGEAISRIYLTKAGQILFYDPNEQSIGNNERNQASIAALFSPTNLSDNELRIAEITSSNSERRFIVFEWTKRIAGVIEQRYQVIIEEHSSNIWFNYLDIININEDTLASAHNSTKQVGFNILSSPQKHLILDLTPQQNRTIKLINEKGGEVSLATTIKLNEVSLNLTDSQYTTAEEQFIDITPSLHDLPSTITITHNNSNVDSFPARTEKINVSLAEQVQIALNTAYLPTYGSLAIKNEKILTYTPNKDVNGDDSFIFTLKDDYVSAKSGLTNITITPVNDAPTVSITTNSGFAIEPGKTVILTAKVVDVDSANVNITWQQTSGEKIEFTVTDDGKNLLFSVPNLTSYHDNFLQFSAKADDGQLQSSASINLTIKGNSGGGIGLLTVLVLILISRVRRT